MVKYLPVVIDAHAGYIKYGKEVLRMDHRKKLLTAAEQIQHLKDKGVTFKIVSEDDAADYLRNNNNYFKLASYRKNYEKYQKGQNKGKYVNLDFGDLKDLAIIDMHLRYAVLLLSLDIEHYAKLQIMRSIEDSGEDGYKICADYIASLSAQQYNSLKFELSRTGNSSYCYGLYEKYDLELPDYGSSLDNLNLPVWVFMETIPFGRLVAFYGFCAKRFSDSDMYEMHFILKNCKELRNAAAHSSCILNDLHQNTAKHETSNRITHALSNAGISPQTRKRRMSNAHIQHIVSLLYAHKTIVTSKGVHDKAVKKLHDLSERINRSKSNYSSNSLITASFEFLQTVIDIWFNS